MDDFAYQAARRRMMAARRRRHLLDPRQPRRLTMRCRLRDWGLDGAALEAELLRKLGPVTDEERALDARIDRENEVMRRALVVLGRGGADGELRLVEHLERRYGARDLAAHPHPHAHRCPARLTRGLGRPLRATRRGEAPC